MKTSIAAIILTYNEEKHIERCIESLKNIVDEVYIVDSFSNDMTVEIAKKMGANVYQNKWINYATQFNWALENCNINTEWVWRIDADEFFENPNEINLNYALAHLSSDISGVYVKRKIVFMGKEILHGGWYPVLHLKIWRYGKGYCENRWMDEHIKLSEGETVELDIIQTDENFNDLTWWTTKHNSYASREMIDLLDSEYEIFSKSSVEPRLFGSSEQRKRYLKLKYLKLPLFIRPFIYFFYVYILKFGFMDGKSGFVWYILQAFWYRFLVDAKIYELKKKVGTDSDVIIAWVKEKYSV
ncbi:glycosyltransferase family 2 protein [Wenyingzhuangia sp. IMCC45574]